MLAQRSFLTQRLKEKREVLESLVAEAPPAKEIHAGWTIKEFLAHLSGWDEVIIEALQAHARGEPVDMTVGGINAYNAKAVHARASLSLDQVIDEWQATRGRVMKTLKDLPDEKYNQQFVFPWGETGTVAYFIDIFVEHEEYHANHLAKWLENPAEIIGEH